MKYAQKVTIHSHFQRSIQITTDIDTMDILGGFVCPESSKQVLSHMVKNITSGQCAFTWTGTYGAGKSSLALLFKALISSDGVFLKMAKFHTGEPLYNDFRTVLLPCQKGRIFIPVVGRPENPVHVIADAVKKSCKGIKIKTQDSKGILDALQYLSKRQDGVVIVIDEMGKFLDAVTRHNGDLYIFQQLAELANRSCGRIVVVGILHQAFNEYARCLNFNAQNEWHKIQGRFIDLAINVAGEEQIALIAKAITAPKANKHYANISTEISTLIAHNKQGVQSHIQSYLLQTFPLHPITTCLLGPLSKRRFGQNQRSIFAFLTSAEAGGFKEFINTTEYDTTILYTPDRLYDYIRFNLEPSIMASVDASHWATGLEALNRCEKQGGDIHHIQVLKTIILLDMFMTQSGIIADVDTLRTVVADDILQPVLHDLTHWSILIFKKYQNLYSLYEGSDFDMDLALTEAQSKIHDIDPSKTAQVTGLRPIIAKKHYHATGALRWFDIKIMTPNQCADATAHTLSKGANGCLIILLGNDTQKNIRASLEKAKVSHPILFTFADNAKDIIDCAKDLKYCQWILDNKPDLGGDAVARREINDRITHANTALNTAIQLNLYKPHDWHYVWKTENKWIKQKHSNQTISTLNTVISHIIDKYIYPDVLSIKSELMNRDKPSPSANTASNNLIKAMILEEGNRQLRFKGFPAEMGLYKIFLENTGIYKNTGNDSWEFVEPDNIYGLKNLWQQTDIYLQQQASDVTIPEIAKFWQQRPLGVKKGMIHILLTLYLKTRESVVTTYIDGIYRPFVDDLYIDYLLKNSPKISMRWIHISQQNTDFVQTVNEKIKAMYPNRYYVLKNPLDTARAIVQIFDSLNKWTLRTKMLSPTATKLRNAIHSANDPNRLLFEDIPNICNNTSDTAQAFGTIFTEIKQFYPNRLEEIGQLLLDALQVGLLTPSTLSDLRKRASKVSKQKSDLRISAFAGRLTEIQMDTHGGIERRCLEGIAGLVAVGATNDWIDLDFERVKLNLAELCDAFKKAELYTYVQTKQQASRVAIAVTVGSGKNRFATQHDLTHLINDAQDKKLKQQIGNTLKTVDKDRAIAILVDALKQQVEDR